MQEAGDRIESAKAGIIAAIAVSLAAAIAKIASHFWLGMGIYASENLLPFLGSLAIAAVSGFLFGVTYRYAVRDETNPHLKTGTLLAFALVRGLGQVEMLLNSQDLTQSLTQIVGMAALVLGESMFWFTIAQACLEFCFSKDLLQPVASDRR
ncbi:hypothetical protein V2H45_03140 [Tumidithrix elongata RA019]|uniref:Uncharacterized protein n=1 Tax=Tumidithrix elongata BACA0141 TaxID=2716417 RepID=A0AAW9PZ37_9CYAN|nr:hypothetical protein [Tumidithrix elongata RA019]